MHERRHLYQPVIHGGAAAALSYTQKVLNQFGANVLSYLPLNDSSGSTAADASGNSRTGTIGGCTLGVTGMGDGETAISLPGTTGNYINWYTVSLRDAFSGAAGSAMIWLKVAGSAVWTNAAYREAICLYINSSNYILIGRPPDNYMLYATYRANATSESYGAIGCYSTNWLHAAITWSKASERTRFYLNGAQYAATATLGTWAGSLNNTSTMLGAYITTDEIWNGSLAHALLLNREATAAEIANVAAWGRTLKRFVILGDSIDSWDSFPLGWVQKLREGHNSSDNIMFNHAVTGHTIITNMDAQVTAAASEAADVIIIKLGTNDNEAGDMNALQAEAEENLAELKSNHPGADIYWMNVLPRWTDVGGGTEEPKTNIRAAIAAACTAQSVTCWDTYTTPWITAADTSDGLHPTAGGMTKIYNEVEARV